MVRIIGTRFSAPRSVVIVLRSCGTILSNLVQLRERSGRLSPTASPDFVCRPHLIKAGSGSDFDLVVCEMMLYGEINRVKFLSVVRGEWNCSG